MHASTPVEFDCHVPRGFTLIELMVTIAVVAVLGTIALPSFSTSIRNSRVTTDSNELLTAVNLARLEAISRTRGVSICAADTTAGLPAACGAANDWSKGWVVFMDDSAGAAVPTAINSAAIIRTWVANGATTITQTPAESMFLRFSSRGESVSGAGTFNVVPSVHCSGQQLRVIDVSATGRASSTRKDCP